jgi:hypothetical protein
MVTNQQPNNRQPGLEAKPAAPKKAADDASAANTAEVKRSVAAWRAMQGLPPQEDNNG